MRRLEELILILTLMIISAPALHSQNRSDGGLKAEITGVHISASRKPVVTFKISDLNGKALDLSDLDAKSVKFTIAALKVEESGGSGVFKLTILSIGEGVH